MAMRVGNVCTLRKLVVGRGASTSAGVTEEGRFLRYRSVNQKNERG